MAIFTFLKLDGISGDSTNSQHQGAIDIVHWIFHKLGPRTGAGTSSIENRPTRGDFTARNDRNLFASMHTRMEGGRRIHKGILLHEVHRDGKLQTSQKYTFENVMVESYSVVHGAGQDERFIMYTLAWDNMKQM